VKDAATGIASRCTILNNVGTAGNAASGIQGSVSGFPPNSAAIRCDDGACARIDNNTINGRSGINSFGIVLGNTGPFINRNTIDAGCPTTNAVAIEANDSFARIQNNIVRGVGGCAATLTTAPNSWALRMTIGTGTNELDVHSNDLLAQGLNLGMPTCHAVQISGAMSSVARGIFRNNILHVGFCPTAFGVEEMSGSADPRIFEFNDIFTTGNASTGVVLYRDEATTNLATNASVNAVVDPTGMSNLSVDPMFVAPVPYAVSANPNYHLQKGSMCIDTGTKNGIPTSTPFTDFFGSSRPVGAGYDIGAVEQ
jgi:hypothetical protein